MNDTSRDVWYASKKRTSNGASGGTISLDDGINLRRRFFDFYQNRRDFETAKRAEKNKKNLPNFSFQPKLDMKSRHLVEHNSRDLVGAPEVRC